jgi:GT2 family glycosyltransferase
VAPSQEGRAPVSVIIPTYGRGTAIIKVLERIAVCRPSPAKIIVHLDAPADNALAEISRLFPDIIVLSSDTRLGPGGGRHRALMACDTPFAVSFDDDSYPIDQQFFSEVERLFVQNEDVALLAAQIWHRNEDVPELSDWMYDRPSFVGCGFAIRVEAYRQIRGYLPRPVAYGVEETDVSLQLFAARQRICQVGALRVFHDTDLKHHSSAVITAASITNLALYAFLHYPVSRLGWGVLQVANRVRFLASRRRFRGIIAGFLAIPLDCYRFRQYRDPVDPDVLSRFFRLISRDPKPTMQGSVNGS